MRSQQTAGLPTGTRLSLQPVPWHRPR
jgi:hypothetical protein